MIKNIIPDVLFIAGAGSLSYGAWLYSGPLGYAVAGGILLITAIRMAAK